MMPLSNFFFFKLQIRFKFYLLTAEKHNASRIDFLCILVRFSEEKKKICNKAALLMCSTCQNKPGQYLIWFGCYYIHRYYWTLFLSRSLLFYVYVCVSVCFFSFLWFYFVCVRFSFFSRLFVCLLSVSVYSFLSNRILHSVEHKFHFRFWLKCSVYVLFILNAVVASRNTSILHFNIGRWMSEFAFSIRSWALISLEFTTHFQLQPTRIFTI